MDDYVFHCILLTFAILPHFDSTDKSLIVNLFRFILLTLIGKALGLYCIRI